LVADIRHDVVAADVMYVPQETFQCQNIIPHNIMQQISVAVS